MATSDCPQRPATTGGEQPGRFLSGRVALVTGGGRGIGRGIARRLAGLGAMVAISYRRDEESAAAVADDIARHGGTAEIVRADLAAAADAERLVRQTEASLGPVDVLVSNAGVASRGRPVADTDPGEPARLLSVHAVAAFQLARLVIPGMRRKGRGDLIFVSSSELGRMRANGAPYHMAKAALEALALTIANEESTHGIHANIVAPGVVKTEMGDRLVRATLGVGGIDELDARQPFGRVTTPDDVADVVAFLLSPSAMMLTGQRIVIDGGTDVLAA